MRKNYNVKSKYKILQRFVIISQCLQPQFSETQTFTGTENRRLSTLVITKFSPHCLFQFWPPHTYTVLLQEVFRNFITYSSKKRVMMSKRHYHMLVRLILITTRLMTRPFISKHPHLNVLSIAFLIKFKFLA